MLSPLIADVLQGTRYLRTVADQIYLALVVNLKTAHSLNEDYTTHSVLTEYLSAEELDALLTGFRDLGVFVEVFVGEAEFFGALTSGAIQGTPFRYKMVYGTVPSGIWRGRDALIPALCGANNIVYCGCDPYSISVLGNKQYSFGLAAAYGFPVAPFWVFSSESGWLNGSAPPENTRVIAKPVLESASIGIDDQSVFVYERGGEARLARLMEPFRQRFLVQEFIAGYEVEVPVIGLGGSNSGAAALGVVGVQIGGNPLLGSRFLSYDLVWDDSYGFYDYFHVDGPGAAAISETANAAYESFDLAGLARFDFRITEDGRFYITDINSIPHLTRFSSCAASIGHLGLPYEDLLAAVLVSALRTGRR